MAGRLPRWDLVCRVVDNLGDAGVMWRLARQLATEHRLDVHLHIDAPAVLQRLVPTARPGATAQGVTVHALPVRPDRSGDDIADVVVTGFHAALPPGWSTRMAARRAAWINLEYLSAEPWVDDFHGLPSPRPDGLIEHFFYPGFGARSGGLLRERDLLRRRDDFAADPANARAFLAALGVTRRDGRTLASLLCYPHAPLAALAGALASSDVSLHLLVPEGVAPARFEAEGGALAATSGGRLEISRIPFLPQADYDCLLWSCDLNFVRGEDSWIRAVWSGKPFAWQVYPQEEGTHLVKLAAFLALTAPVAVAGDDAAPPPAARPPARPDAARPPVESPSAGNPAAGSPLAGACRWWNGAPGASVADMVRLVADPALAAPSLANLQARIAAPDLATRLVAFAAGLHREDFGKMPSRDGPPEL